MITLRRADERGLSRTDWLDSRHTFSFGSYHDPAHMGFRALRVINEDRVRPGAGFPLHPHSDMEIVTFVLAGALEHRDDLGHAETIRAGELQRISAGSGIRHSEGNPSATEEVHFLQIWLLPETRGLPPSYEKRSFAAAAAGTLALLASRDGREGSARIRTDASLFHAALEEGDSLTAPLSPGRHAWLQLIEGSLSVNGPTLVAGDGAAISAEERLLLRARKKSRLLLFELA